MLLEENAEVSLIKKRTYFLLVILILTYFYACQSAQKKEVQEATILSNAQKDTLQIPEEKPINLNAYSGVFTDIRDGQNYQWVRLKDGKIWMAHNLNYEISGTWCYNDQSINCQKNGRLYTWEAANNACPKGWRLPTDAEWWAMASHYGKAYNSYPGQEKMEGKDDGEEAYKALIKGGDTRFNIILGGSFSPTEGFDYLNDLGCYWTSSANNTTNALGYYFYIHSRGLARDSYPKGSGFSCRCVQD